MRALIVAVLVVGLPAAAAGKFSISSSDWKANAAMPDKNVFNGMGCTGQNESPQLAWANAPEGTKSFALSVYDPDAPTGSGWWHWVVYNIPATAKELAAGAGGATGKLPDGTLQGRTDFGQQGYGGACPPPGDKPHRYIVTVWALKVDKLDVPADASAAMIGYMSKANPLASATMTVKYGRKK
jgi:Raf kinase inhibitor-like YbhB/YbcL family protein